MILTEYEVVNESPIIHTYLRGKDGKRVVETDKNFKPYFYIPRNEKHKLTNNKNVLFIEDVSVTDIHGEMVSKVFCKLPKYVKELRGVVSKSYEADILYPTRYTIDMYNDIPGVPISVVYLDIEINVSSTFPNVMLAQEEITAITASKWQIDGFIDSDQIEETQLKISADITKTLNNAAKSMEQAINLKQKGIDTPKEYKKLSTFCDEPQPL